MSTMLEPRHPIVRCRHETAQHFVGAFSFTGTQCALAAHLKYFSPAIMCRRAKVFTVTPQNAPVGCVNENCIKWRLLSFKRCRAHFGLLRRDSTHAAADLPAVPIDGIQGARDCGV